MQKSKLNLTLDKDLIEYAKTYAQEQRTTVSEVVTQFILGLKRARQDDPTEVVLADPAFSEGLLNTMARIKSGEIKWQRYDEVF